MEIAVLSDTISSIAYSAQSLGISNSFLNHPHNALASDQQQQSPPKVHISAAFPPRTKTLTRSRVRNNRRVKRKIQLDNGGEEDGYFVFNDGGDFSNGGGSFGGGGGKGWNFGGGSNWEEFSDNSVPDPAFDFVYGVLRCIAMSNCLHYALKKVVRCGSMSNYLGYALKKVMGCSVDGFGDQEKVQMPFIPAC